MTTLDANQDALTVVGRFNEAWHSHDLAAALALTTDDCILETTAYAPDGARVQGRAEPGRCKRYVIEHERAFHVESIVDTRRVARDCTGSVVGVAANQVSHRDRKVRPD